MMHVYLIELFLRKIHVFLYFHHYDIKCFHLLSFNVSVVSSPLTVLPDLWNTCRSAGVIHVGVILRYF